MCCRWDNEINTAFEAAFPEYLDDAKLRKLNEDEIKSAAGKKKWREFMLPFEKVVADYNFGTLVRLDCEGEYDQENTMFGELRHCCEREGGAWPTRLGVRSSLALVWTSSVEGRLTTPG